MVLLFSVSFQAENSQKTQTSYLVICSISHFPIYVKFFGFFCIIFPKNKAPKDRGFAVNQLFAKCACTGANGCACAVGHSDGEAVCFSGGNTGEDVTKDHDVFGSVEVVAVCGNRLINFSSELAFVGLDSRVVFGEGHLDVELIHLGKIGNVSEEEYAAMIQKIKDNL